MESRRGAAFTPPLALARVLPATNITPAIPVAQNAISQKIILVNNGAFPFWETIVGYGQVPV